MIFSTLQIYKSITNIQMYKYSFSTPSMGVLDFFLEIDIIMSKGDGDDKLLLYCMVPIYYHLSSTIYLLTC